MVPHAAILFQFLLISDNAALVKRIAEAHSRLDLALWSCRVVATVTRRSLPLNQISPPERVRYEWVGMPGFARTDETDPNGALSVAAWTPNRVFRANRNAESRPFNLATYSVPKKSPEHWRHSGMHPHMVPIRWNDLRFDALLEGPSSLEIASATCSNDSRGRKTVLMLKAPESRVKSQLRAELVLRDDLNFAVERFALYGSQQRMDTTKWSWLIDVSYAFPADSASTFPLLRRASISSRDSDSGEGSSTVADILSMEYGPKLTDYDFSLASIGLPEPMVSGKRSLLKYYWWPLLAMAAAATAVATYWWLKRR